MTVEREVARLSAIVEASLGPNGSFTSTMKEVKDQLHRVDKKQADHDIKIDRLEQNEKRRSKWLTIVGTAWIGLALTWVWDKFR